MSQAAVELKRTHAHYINAFTRGAEVSPEAGARALVDYVKDLERFNPGNKRRAFNAAMQNIGYCLGASVPNVVFHNGDVVESLPPVVRAINYARTTLGLNLS